MKLTDWMIKLFIKCGWLRISPFDPKLVNPNSIDVRLGDKLSEVRSVNMNSRAYPIDPLKANTFFTSELYWDGDGAFRLAPHRSVIGCLAEDIALPRWICSEIRGKSSLGRLFIDNSSVAGWIDAGWSGVLTIEIQNNSNNHILLTKGMKIGQVIFNLTLPCWKHYGERVTSKYQNQTPGQGSKGIG